MSIKYNNELAVSSKTDNYATGARFGKVCVLTYAHNAGGVVKNYEYSLTTLSKLGLPMSNYDTSQSNLIYGPLVCVDSAWNNPSGAIGALKLNQSSGAVSFISTYSNNNAYSYLGLYF